MTVFVVHPIRQDDISAAAKWGTFQFVNGGYIFGDELYPDPKASATSPAWVMPVVETMSLVRAARAYRPRLDYVLIAGDHLQYTLLVALIARHNAEFTVLRYDKKISDYIPVCMHVGLASKASDMLGYTPNIGERPDVQERHQGESPADSDEIKRIVNENTDTFGNPLWSGK